MLGVKYIELVAAIRIHGIILSAFFLFVAASASAQDDCGESRYSKLHNNSFQCKWVFFQLRDTISGVVIKHDVQQEPCGAVASASVTIIRTAKDTIRVLNMCNELENYHRGLRVKVFPAATPPYQVQIPFHYDVSDERHNEYVARTNAYDETVQKTTWGEIVIYESR